MCLLNNLFSATCLAFIAILFDLFLTILSGEVLFREDFSGNVPGRLPAALNYTGNIEGGSESPLLEVYQDFHVA